MKESDNTVVFIAIIICFLIAGYIYVNNNQSSCEEGLFCIASGQEFRFSYTLNGDNGISSYGGYSAIKTITGQLKTTSGKSYDLPARAINNDSWEDEIVIMTHALDMDGHSPIDLRMGFDIPSITHSNNETATLLFTGKVVYPYSAQNSNSYTNRTSQFSNQVSVKLMGEDYENSDQIWNGWFWISLVLGILMVIGIFTPDED